MPCFHAGLDDELADVARPSDDQDFALLGHCCRWTPLTVSKRVKERTQTVATSRKWFSDDGSAGSWSSGETLEFYLWNEARRGGKWNFTKMPFLVKIVGSSSSSDYEVSRSLACMQKAKPMLPDRSQAGPRDGFEPGKKAVKYI